ncbi:hypothetical protein ACFL39_01020 [Gemmatimonadota bacterium]
MLILQEFKRHIEELGAEVVTESLANRHIDTCIRISMEGMEQRLVLEVLESAPYPGQVPRFNTRKTDLAEHGTPTLVAPYISEGLGKALVEVGWSWADGQGNFDIRAGTFRLRQRLPGSGSPRRSQRLPAGSGGLAIIRMLIHGVSPPYTMTEIARAAGVTQPRASQVFNSLMQLGLADRVNGKWSVDRGVLLEAFLEEYGGPGGHEHHLYGLGSASETAIQLAEIAPEEVFISADLAADVLAPWRTPTHLIVYSRRMISLDSVDLVAADGEADSNVIFRVPKDESFFRVPAIKAGIQGGRVYLTHPSQVLWDLLRLGGEDRAEAGERLKTWILEHA